MIGEYAPPLTEARRQQDTVQMLRGIRRYRFQLGLPMRLGSIGPYTLQPEEVTVYVKGNPIAQRGYSAWLDGRKLLGMHGCAVSGEELEQLMRFVVAELKYCVQQQRGAQLRDAAQHSTTRRLRR